MPSNLIHEESEHPGMNNTLQTLTRLVYCMEELYVHKVRCGLQTVGLF